MFTISDIPGVIAQMTLEEKASLCSGSDFWHTKPIERLGIPAVMMTDGPHGLRKQAGNTDHLGLNDSVPATCYPSAAGLGSTWNRDLIRRMGEKLGAETRANEVAVILGPGINMKRSPLCGRNFEYFSEDPMLASELASALVEGIQSQGVGTSLKHFAVNNQENDRMRVDAEVDERTLRETYLSAFERVVDQAKPWTIMCSYNRINGTYASENHWLLTEVLRDEWGYDGMVVSDWGAVNNRPDGVRAGLDLEMPASGGVNDARIVAAVGAGELSMAELDLAVERILTMVAKAQPALADPGVVDLDGAHALAREVATAATVLLKNDGVLPLASLDQTVVIGEMARTPRYQGAGSSLVNPAFLDSALSALQALRADIPFAPGYRLADAAGQEGQEASDEELRAAAVDAARGATALLFLGLPAIDESEGYDRTHMNLLTSHVDLLRAVADVADKVVVVLSNGSAVVMSDWEDSADAILEGWLGGQAGGGAIADLLTGAASPSGRLAESIPVALADIPAQLNFPGERGSVRYGEGTLIGYRGLDAANRPVSYPFGHGLTYTTFEYSDLVVETAEVTATMAPGDGVLTVRARVTNTGDRAGVAVPQLYVGRPDSQVIRAPRELRGFESLALEPGASAVVEFGVNRRELSFWDVAVHGWQVEPGTYVVEVGASSRDLPLRAEVTVVAPDVTPPLRIDSTLKEWQSKPEAWAALRPTLGAFGEMIDPQSEFPGDEALSVFLLDMPVNKVPVMFDSELTFEALEELISRFQ